MKFQLLDENGAALDAHFSLEGSNLVYHSRGGSKGSAGQRNADYAAGLRRLFHKLKVNDLSIDGIWVDSAIAQALPIDERSIWFTGDASLSVEELAAAVSNRMKRVGRQSAARPDGGNSTKRIRISLARRVDPVDAAIVFSAARVHDGSVAESVPKADSGTSQATVNWTDQENDLIVADYFEMLSDELQGRQYNKAAHRRALLPQLVNKSNGSVEFKHQNISAVLQRLGLPLIDGYKPRHNFQGTLVEAVERWTLRQPDWQDELLTQAQAKPEAQELRISMLSPPPKAPDLPPGDAKERIRTAIRKIDFAGQDEKNRKLGLAGEELVLEFERRALREAGRPDLADRVLHVSKEEGDGAGYDIASFFPDGRERLVEVKTTNGGERAPFYVSSNELAVAERNAESWVLVRVWNFSLDQRAFELRPPIEDHVQLAPTVYRASFG